MSDTQVKKETPEVPADHPVVLRWKDWMPGRMAFASERGYFSGCMLKGFAPEWRQDLEAEVSAAQVANEYFTANPGFLVVELIPHGREILCVLSKTKSPQERDEDAAVAKEWDEIKARRAAEREEREAKGREAAEAAAKEAALAAEAAAKETKRLVELGKRHEANCRKEKA
jgi:hypothetical protein